MEDFGDRILNIWYKTGLTIERVIDSPTSLLLCIAVPDVSIAKAFRDSLRQCAPKRLIVKWRKKNNDSV